MIDYKPAAMLTYIRPVTDFKHYAISYFVSFISLPSNFGLDIQYNLIHTKVAITVNFVSFIKYPISYFPVHTSEEKHRV